MNFPRSPISILELAATKESDTWKPSNPNWAAANGKLSQKDGYYSLRSFNCDQVRGLLVAAVCRAADQYTNEVCLAAG